MLLALEIVFILLLVGALCAFYKSEIASMALRMPRAVVKEIWDGRERREHMRFDKNLEVVYFLIKKPRLSNNCKTMDISKGGARLVLKEKLAKGVMLSLKITIPACKDCAELEGEIMWTEEVNDKDESGRRSFHSGIKFLGIREPEGRRLIDYLEHLTSKP